MAVVGSSEVEREAERSSKVTVAFRQGAFRDMMRGNTNGTKPQKHNVQMAIRNERTKDRQYYVVHHTV